MVVWVQQELKMLARLKTDFVKITSRPATVEVEGGVTIHIDQYNNVTINGYNNLNLDSKGDVNIKGENINIEAKTHLVHKAKRIDLNPDETESRYVEFVKKEKK